MADNHEAKDFAGNALDWTQDAGNPMSIATRQDVANYVYNAFLSWHKPDHELLRHLASTLDGLLMFLGEHGIEVKDGKITMTVEEVAEWLETKQAQQAKAAQEIN